MFVEAKSNDRSRGQNLTAVNSVLLPYFDLSPTSMANNIYGLPEAVIRGAQFVSDNLWEKNDLVVVSQESVDSLMEQINELERSILSSGISAQIKDRMLQTLAILRLAVTRINLVGHDEVLSHMEALLGQSVVAVSASSPEHLDSSKGIFTRVLELLRSTKDVVDAASAVYPVLEGGASLIRKILTQGAED